MNSDVILVMLIAVLATFGVDGAVAVRAWYNNRKRK